MLRDMLCEKSQWKNRDFSQSLPRRIEGFEMTSESPLDNNYQPRNFLGVIRSGTDQRALNASGVIFKS